MSTIVEFPKHKIIRDFPSEPIQIEKIQKAKEKGLHVFAESIVDEITTGLYQELELTGIDMESDEFNKDFALTVDALRSTIYRALDLKHHLHEFVDNNVVLRKLSDIIEEDKDTFDKFEETES